MDDRSQVLLLLKRGAGDPLGAERAGDAAIQKRRGQLDRVAGHYARVEAIEPARSHRVPRSLLDHGMIVDAIALRFAERSIGNLVHADRARYRAVQLERIPGQLPAPGRAGYRIAGAFDLGERGKKPGRHDGGRVVAEDRLVLPPCLGRRLGERAPHREEQLGRLADDLVAPVGREPERQDARPTDDDADATAAPSPRPFRTQDQSAYTPFFLMIGPHLSISDLSRR